MASSSPRRKRQADPASRRSLFRHVFETAASATVRIGKDGTILSVNKRFESLFSCSRDEVEGKKKLAEFAALPFPPVPPNRRPPAASGVEEETDSYQCQLVDGNGDTRDVRARIVPIPGTGRSIVSFLDITRYTRMQRAFDESEKKFRLIFQRSPDPALLLDGYTFVDWNEAASAIMGCTSKDRLLGLNPSHISPRRQPDGALSGSRSKQNIETARMNGSVRFEWVFRSFRKELFWADVSLTLIPMGGKEYLYATWRDISARKKTEEALGDRERQLRAALDASPVAILWSDIKGSVEYVNPKFVQLFGYRLADIPTLTEWFRLAYSNSPHAISLSTASAIAERQGAGEWEDSDVTITCKDGSIRYVAVAAAAVANRILVTFNDLTDRRQAEEALSRREKELENKSVNLEEVNTALKVLLRHRDDDRRALENSILVNVKELVSPYIEKLKCSHLTERQQTYMTIIESGLEDIVSPFLQKMTHGHVHFTPAEIQIANLIRGGRTSKEMGEILNVSRGTVDTHRNSIRNKLGLRNENINLRSYLLALQEKQM